MDSSSSKRVHRVAILMALVIAVLANPRTARADNAERITVLEENDSIYFNSDKHYTQGIRASNLGPAVPSASGWNAPFNWIADLAPIFQDGTGTERRYAIVLGQSIFTPKNLTLRPPDATDRPYGGWLYIGTSLLQERNLNTLENLELDLGVVGPGALGKQAQSDFHQFIGDAEARGWSHQIQNEPGIALSYERLWRLPLFHLGGIGSDVVPQIGATVGNVFTYGEIGAIFRVGHNLQADYGPVRIRPALSGTDYFDASHLERNLGYYWYVGAEGRAVGRNIFLDGNSFRQSPNVQKRILVADCVTGVTVFGGTAWRLDFSMARRTREFIGQNASDVLGTAALSIGF